MNRITKKIIIFLLLSIGIVLFNIFVIPFYVKDYFFPSEIEKSKCQAYCRWLDESLLYYSDEY